MAPQGERWSHPRLGEFTSDGYVWTGVISVPAFDVFGAGFECELTLSNEDHSGVPPSEDVSALAEKVVGNMEHLVDALLNALWRDFLGDDRYRSGMWWHGAMHEAFEYCETTPTNAATLAGVLKPAGIRVHNIYHVDGSESLLATLRFNSMIDEEHGVGVLTDGSQILGTGYMMDASPFRVQ